MIVVEVLGFVKGTLSRLRANVAVSRPAGRRTRSTCASGSAERRDSRPADARASGVGCTGCWAGGVVMSYGWVSGGPDIGPAARTRPGARRPGRGPAVRLPGNRSGCPVSGGPDIGPVPGMRPDRSGCPARALRAEVAQRLALRAPPVESGTTALRLRAAQRRASAAPLAGVCRVEDAGRRQLPGNARAADPWSAGRRR